MSDAATGAAKVGQTLGRRQACAWLLAAAAPAYLQAATERRVAWVSIDSPNPDNPNLKVWREAMRQQGWIEGRNLVIDLWWAEGSADKLKALVPQVLARHPEVIVATTGPAVRPFVDAQVPVPVVFAFSADPVQGKVVNSWARPGVNRTGVSYFALELVPKRMQLIKEMLPRARPRSSRADAGVLGRTPGPRWRLRCSPLTAGRPMRCWSSPAWWPPAMRIASPPGRCAGACPRCRPGRPLPMPAT